MSYELLTTRTLFRPPDGRKGSDRSCARARDDEPCGIRSEGDVDAGRSDVGSAVPHMPGRVHEMTLGAQDAQGVSLARVQLELRTVPSP